MNLDGLTNAYTLTPLTVSPHQLLLDPTNPRLITEASQFRNLSPAQIAEPSLQRQVLEQVCGKEHDVKRLINSIREMGFIGGLHEIIVKELRPNGPYLVIEGNRRTAALRSLLSNGANLRADVKTSIERVQVKLFQFKQGTRHDEQSVIDALLGSIHIDGPKEWGALERANYICRSYTRLLGRAVFRYDPDVSRDVGATFKLSGKAVHRCLVICRVYEQLVEADVGVEPKHYTLIDLATKTRLVAEPYFELDKSTCELSEVGVERLVQLMIRGGAPVHNPKLFKMFVDIHANGTLLELSQCVHGERALTSILEAIRRRRVRSAFRDDLERVMDSIGELNAADFQGTEVEKNLIRKIEALVNRRLRPLVV